MNNEIRFQLVEALIEDSNLDIELASVWLLFRAP